MGSKPSLASLVVDYKRKKLDAVHGTGYEFDEFELGVNQGTHGQMYGEGIYASTADEIGGNYAPRDLDHEEWMMSQYQAADGDYYLMDAWERALSHETPWSMREMANDPDIDAGTREAYLEVAQALSDNPPKKGHMLRLEIDADAGELLNWDAPLSEQPEFVQNAAAGMGLPSNPKGKDIYYRMVDASTPAQEAPTKIRQALQKIGAKGITYKERNSADAQNYVIFDPKIIEIAERYAMPVTYVGAGGLTAYTALSAEETQAALPGKPAMFKGKDVKTLSPDEFAAFGREYGVENLGPLSKIESVGDSGQSVAVPGGLEGEFTYADLIWLKANPIDPSQLDNGTRIAIQNKMVRAVSPAPGNELDVFNRYVFGMLSPNQPLTPNEFEAAALRVRSQDDIDRFASFIDWEPGEKVSKERRKAAETKMAEFFETQAGSRGGMGLKGSADYTNLAEFAKLYKKDPSWWTKNESESWIDFVERVQTQGRGLSSKVASFSTVWQDPVNAAISAIDRHMAREFMPELFATKKSRKQFEQGVVKRFNSMVDEVRRAKDDPEAIAALKKKGFPIGATSKVKNLDQVFGQRGGDAVFMERIMSLLGAKSPKYRLKTGEINPNLPENLKNTEFLVEPETAQVVGDAYRRALTENERIAVDNGMHLFSQQWMLWDNIRRRLEPHEVMFPGLEKLPPMSRNQLESALSEHKQAGYMNSSKELVADPVTGELNPRMKPTRPMDYQKAMYYTAAGGVGLTQADNLYAEEIPNMQAVAQRAQTFSLNRDNKNRAWTGLKDAVGKMTQPFQPLAEFVAHSAAGMGSGLVGFAGHGGGGDLQKDFGTPYSPQAVEDMRASIRGVPEQIGFGPMDDNSYQRALNDAMGSVADTVTSNPGYRAFVEPMLPDAAEFLIDQYQQEPPHYQDALSGLGEYIGNAIR